MPSPIGPDTPAILVVDDHPANLLAIEAVLAPLGYTVVKAGSGPEALERLSAQDFVLILLDVHMPGMDGYETVRRLRERERSRDIPVVFLTAIYSDPEHTYRGYALGAVDYVSKPFDAEVMRGKVRALVALYLRGQRAERERGLESERLKDLFLGAVGHDLRNPLSSVVMASQLLSRGAACGNPRHEALAQKIERAGKRMQRIIDDILDLTRGQFAGGIPLTTSPTNSGDVCRTVVDEHRLAHPNRVIELEIAGETIGAWDPDRLGRVVSNLVGNAIEHSEGGPVRVRLHDVGAGISLEVHNGGAPIPPEVQAGIFEPFRRGDTSPNGLGLGLYIVSEIVRAHHGTVTVRSTAEDGTSFTVTLPKSAPA